MENNEKTWYENAKVSDMTSDNKESFKSAFRTKYEGDKKQLHMADIQFINNGEVKRIPDNFTKNEDGKANKLIIELIWDGKEYVHYVNEAESTSSAYGQLVGLARTNKGLKGVKIKFIMTGLIEKNNKKVQYNYEFISKEELAEKSASSSNSKLVSDVANGPFNDMEYKFYKVIMSNPGIRIDLLSNKLNLTNDSALIFVKGMVKKGILKEDGLGWSCAK